MSYNDQNSYGQMNPYNQQESRYEDYRGGRPQYNGPQQSGYSSRYGDVEQGNYEMQNINGQSSGGDPNAILNECRDIDRGIDYVQSLFPRLRDLLGAFAKSTDDNFSPELTNMMADIKAQEKSYTTRMIKIKSNPESGNPRNSAQVGRVARKLDGMQHQYQVILNDSKKEANAAFARRMRTVRPDITEEELQIASQNPTENVFVQSIYETNRRGEAQSILQNVRSRHDAIQQIEKSVIETAELQQQLNAMVVMQEQAVTQIEQKGEEVNDNVGKANVEIDGAITKARSRNRKKWWCLLIILLIIIIVVVVAVVVTEINKNK